MNKKHVVVGLSGGVDSSVAAYLLKAAGYQVIGLFMKNWHDESVTRSEECPWLEDSNDAVLVAEKLGIPFQTVDLSNEYKERIVAYMFDEYSKGRTPNPDVLCNREIKFNVFMNVALSLGADFVATGHYCRKHSFKSDSGRTIYQLLVGVDADKDQSYFLCQLTQKQLSRALFPIGSLQKSEVRKIAASQKLVTATKRDSQGLCFIGKVKLPDFLQQQLQYKTGNIIEISDNHPIYSARKDAFSLAEAAAKIEYSAEDGKVVGQHQGAHFFTIGQRKGLSVGGTRDPLFVIATDIRTNTVFVGQRSDHPGLYRYTLLVLPNDIHWVRNDLKLSVGESLKVQARIRYRQPLQEAALYCVQAGIYIAFEQAQSAITSGQFVVWYQDEELLGSGVIA